MQSRRKFLLLSTAAGAVVLLGGAGAALVTLDRNRAWIRSVLRRSLPGYEIGSEGLDRFVDDYNAARHDSLKLRAFAATQNIFDTTSVLPKAMGDAIEGRERMILTQFLLGSDFFEQYPSGTKVITYRG